jgi:hypothetical protein
MEMRTGWAIAFNMLAALSRLSALSSLNSILEKFHYANIYKYVNMMKVAIFQLELIVKKITIG